MSVKVSISERASKLNMQKASNRTRPAYSCSKDVLRKALNNVDKPSVRRQPRQGNKPVRLACLDVPHVDPTMALKKAAKH